MTGAPTIQKQTKKLFRILKFLKLGIILLVFILAMIHATEIKNGVIYGIRLSVLGVIPAIFPFLVFSDLLADLFSFGKRSKKAFSSLFGLPPCLLSAFISGSLCGFPIGGGICSEKYKSSMISRDDCERGICLCSNPSLGFCLGAVGAVCYGDIKVGAIVYFCMIISTVILGASTKRQTYSFDLTNENSKQKFNFANSIKIAALSSLTISAFIMFFSAVISLIECYVSNNTFTGLISAFFEVGNAVSRISLLPIDKCASIAFSGFAVGFSGLSVLLQAKATLGDDISIKRLVVFKFFSGILCGLLSYLSAIIFML